MRTTLFISHATPADNEFAAWLAAKLQLHGYRVWVDIKELDPATDFWKTIETAIRDDSVKFLFVVTSASIGGKRDGVMKELAIADRVRKTYADFIIPLRVDNTSFDDFPVEIVRQNAIDFYNDWAGGLIKLLEYLEKQDIPKFCEVQAQMDTALQRWKSIKTSESNSVIEVSDDFYSNLYPVSFPTTLYIYRGEDVEKWLKEKRFPYIKINSIIITLVCINCISKHCILPFESYAVPFIDALSAPQSTYLLGIEIRLLNRICVNLLNWNIDEHLRRSGLLRYHTISTQNVKSKYYFRSGTKSRVSSNSRPKLLSGTYKGKTWHYGVSAYYTKFPYSGIIIKWHLIFTDNSGNILADAQQIRARRSKGRLLFNKEWLTLLKAALYFLSNGTNNIAICPCCLDNAFHIAVEPYTFESSIGYIEPRSDPQSAVKEFDDNED